MAGPTTYVQGLSQTVRALEQVGIDAADMKEVFTGIGQLVAGDAQSLSPRLTGRLASSIKPTRTKNKAAVRAGGARAAYAGVAEYGWPRRGIAATSFLRRAIDSNTTRAVELMESGLDDVITRHMNGG